MMRSRSLRSYGVPIGIYGSENRGHTDCTFIVAPRHRDFIKNMTTGAMQADMTLIIVCATTRPTVQRETIVQVTGDVKAKLSATHGSCVPLPDEAGLPRAISTAALLGTRPIPASKTRRS